MSSVRCGFSSVFQRDTIQKSNMPREHDAVLRNTRVCTTVNGQGTVLGAFEGYQHLDFSSLDSLRSSFLHTYIADTRNQNINDFSVKLFYYRRRQAAALRKKYLPVLMDSPLSIIQALAEYPDTKDILLGASVTKTSGERNWSSVHETHRTERPMPKRKPAKTEDVEKGKKNCFSIKSSSKQR